jgi:hypothetical protein
MTSTRAIGYRVGMDRKTLITRAIILAFAILAVIEGWSLATAPRHASPPAGNAAAAP